MYRYPPDGNGSPTRRMNNSNDGRGVNRTQPASPQRLGGSGELDGAQAAEQRAHLANLERQRKQQEKEERERRQRERLAREQIEKEQLMKRRSDDARRYNLAREQERKQQVREHWAVEGVSRSRSHQPPPPAVGQTGAHARMEEEKKKRVQAKQAAERQAQVHVVEDEDEELQRALQASIEEAAPKSTSQGDVNSSDAQNVQYVGDSDDDEEFQRALMMSTAETEKPKPKPTPKPANPLPQSQFQPRPSYNHTSSTSQNRTHTSTSQTHTTQSHSQSHTQTRTSHSTTHSTHTTNAQPRVTNPPMTRPQPHVTNPPRPVVHDVDGDVDMDLTGDPELQDALLQSLEPLDQTIAKEKAKEKAEREAREKATRDRIFGEPPSTPDRYAGEEDRELQDALMASLQEGGRGGGGENEVIDVDNVRGRGSTATTQRGPIITDVDDDEDDDDDEFVRQPDAGGAYEAVPEDEDAELQSALMYSLNPNQEIPPQPVMNPYEDYLSPERRPQQYAPPDPAISAARRLRIEQDVAYQQSLAEDREKERRAKEEEERARKQKELEEAEERKKQAEEQARRELRDKAGSLLPPEPKEGQGVTLVLRMPNGTRFPRRFNATDTLQDLRNFIESKANESNLSHSYEISSDFPKKTFHDQPSDRSLADAGISGRMLLNVQEI